MINHLLLLPYLEILLLLKLQLLCIKKLKNSKPIDTITAAYMYHILKISTSKYMLDTFKQNPEDITL
jgi:hypothetical protein